MRVQMQDQHLRLRLQEDEFRQLLEGGTVENRTHLPDGQQAVQQVHLADAVAWDAEPSLWRVALPAAELRAYAGRLPTRDGLHFTLSSMDVPDLQLQFDVDVRDSTRTRMPRHGQREAR
ncbi:hypothetical protein [Oleiagrimonas sp.]|jgi:hypothetical protein|uniref:hypothetical protein n=1 Tax=Oleiagrimonas sp. TaxID=2010330 RepID=UPI002610508B|nr:hypothetical protein [Oleiagrimonas sp.]MDA3914986.1 hypothetical protein [Oleiagrimonas sp.]